MSARTDIENLIKGELKHQANESVKKLNDGSNDIKFENSDFEAQARSIAVALNPVIEQLEALTKAVNKMQSNLPTAIGAAGTTGSAASGAYVAATSSVNTDLLTISKDLKILKS